jgi:hypothetical protein
MRYFDNNRTKIYAICHAGGACKAFPKGFTMSMIAFRVPVKIKFIFLIFIPFGLIQSMI